MTHTPIRTTLLRAALLGGALLLAGCDSVEQRIADKYEDARAFLDEGEFVKATVAYREILRLDPTELAAHMGLAEAYERQSNFTRALTHYLIVTENSDQFIDAYVKGANYMLLGGEIDRALKMSERALELEPENPDVLSTQASIEYRMGNVETALNYANDALAIDPQHLTANIVIVTEQVESGNVETGLAQLDSVLELHPREISVHLMKLRLLEISGLSSEIPKQLRVMIETFPDTIEIKQTLAQWHARSGEFGKAEALWRQISEENPEESKHALAVVQFLTRTQGVEAARAELHALLEKSPESWPFQAALAALEYSQGNEGAAKEMLNQVALNNSDRDTANSARIQLARLAITEGDLEGGAKLIDAVLSSDKTNVSALAMLAALQINDREYDKAVLTARKALAESPEAVNLLLLAARAYELNGNAALAGEQLGLATRLSNYTSDVALRYVQFLRSNNQVAGAETVLAQTARRDPTNRDVLSQLAEVRLQLEDWIGAQNVAEQLRRLDDTGSANRIAAAALSGQERFSESIALLQSSISPEQNASGAMTQLVMTYVQADDLEQAHGFVDRVLDQNAQNLEAQILKAMLLEHEGETDASLAALNSAISDHPAQPAPYIRLAQFQVRLGDLDAALETSERGLEATGERTEVRLMHAAVLEQLSRHDEAIEAYEELYQVLPQSIIVANNLASLLAEHRSEFRDERMRAHNIARRLRSSDVPQMQDTWGWTLYLTGEYEQALRSLRPAAEALPDNALVQYHLGMTYMALERPDLAKAQLQKVKSLEDPARFPHTEAVEKALAEIAAAEAAEAERLRLEAEDAAADRILDEKAREAAQAEREAAD